MTLVGVLGPLIEIRSKSLLNNYPCIVLIVGLDILAMALYSVRSFVL